MFKADLRSALIIAWGNAPGKGLINIMQAESLPQIGSYSGKP
ncbi:hypothetical protein [Rubellicoccus peritrichatus]|uniref:Uncharacterized protein n=1 Tax=Rubellicoccus peritrichatus TaxID=3080537 RepID=A0AAQ3L6R7_9BACT|nr:hypothetical protein [Puniceicoccus sp. CR14]WOO40091.1 hypothetical protein RZN69_15830 [Puniceicoccus sp. CR14]